MDKIRTIVGVVLATLFLLPSYALQAEGTTEMNEVIKEKRTTKNFTHLKVSGAITTILKQGNQTEVVVETDKENQQYVKTQIENGTLILSADHIKSPSRLNVYVTSPKWESLQATGASSITTESAIQAQELRVNAQGATDLNLILDTERLIIRLNGASDTHLSGSADKMQLHMSGATDLNADDLICEEIHAELNGAAMAHVNATEELIAQLSAASDIIAKNSVPIQEIKRTDNNRHVKYPDPNQHSTVSVQEYRDSTKITVGKMKVEVYEGRDSTQVIVGRHRLVVDDDGNVSINKKPKRHYFNGHWGGIDLGVNGFVNSDFETSIPQFEGNNYDFLDLRYEKSIQFNLNLYEQNFNLINNHLGIITGLGLQYNNYRFNDKVILDPDADQVFGYKNTNPDRSYLKSKLVVNYLTVPLLLEYQTNRFSRVNSFHMTAGMVLGLRIGSHSKQVYKNGSKNKNKDRDDFHLQPFRYDLMARIGWGDVNLFASYSMNTLFKKDKAPELYPFTIGITLTNW